ncbi:MAG TPA: hypothetical protein VG077_19650 [Verrucomicrobiae bacterium]|nr:hypothetical protein [Verrucomicrobiae bacterium]
MQNDETFCSAAGAKQSDDDTPDGACGVMGLGLQICRAYGALKVMTTEYVPPTEIGRQRHAWFQEHAKAGMTFDEVVWPNDKAVRLFPPS